LASSVAFLSHFSVFFHISRVYVPCVISPFVFFKSLVIIFLSFSFISLELLGLSTLHQSLLSVVESCSNLGVQSINRFSFVSNTYIFDLDIVSYNRCISFKTVSQIQYIVFTIFSLSFSLSLHVIFVRSEPY